MGRQARCTSNLRQVGIALTMYFDDFESRLKQITNLTTAAYLPSKDVLICPADRLGNWGNLVNFAASSPPRFSLADNSFPSEPEFAGDVAAGAAPAPSDPFPEADEPNNDGFNFSYLHPLAWEDWTWDYLKGLSSEAGVSACQLHGIGIQDEFAPSVFNFQGLLLRLRRDGAVVRRQIFWNAAAPQERASAPSFAPPSFDGSAELSSASSSSISYPWQLFVDGEGPQ
jgi:hypothetical protein